MNKWEHRPSGAAYYHQSDAGAGIVTAPPPAYPSLPGGADALLLHARQTLRRSTRVLSVFDNVALVYNAPCDWHDNAALNYKAPCDRTAW